MEVQFLGLTDLGVYEEDVELRWRIVAAGQDLGVFPVFGFSGRPLLDIVEFDVTRSEGRADVRVRMAHGGRFPPDLAGALASHSIGLRLSSGLATWDTAMRDVQTAEGTPGRPREFALDGRLQIELVAAPDARQDIGGWLLQTNTNYRIRYRIHNRTAVEQPVHIRVIANEEFARVESPLDGPGTIIPGEPLELSLLLRVGEGVGGCFHCLRVIVGSAPSGPFSDEVGLDAQIVPAPAQ